MNKVLAQGLPKAIARGAKMEFTVGGKLYKFIVVSPQIAGGWASEAMIQNVMNDVKAKYRVDETRVYLTGLSAGGYGTWNYVASGKEYADNVAAIVPVSPAAIAVNKLDNFCNTVVAANVPVWQFSGGTSGDASFRGNMEKFETRYNSCNPTVKAISTVIAGGGHDANTWDKAYDATHTYNNPNIYEWMLQFKKGGVTPPPAANKPPVANAGTNVTVTLPVSSVSLNGSASADSDGNISAYRWAQVSGPATSTISPNTAARATASGLTVAGTYVFELTVTDNYNATAKARVTAVVQAAAIPPPVVNFVSNNISVTAPVTAVTLDGSRSSAPSSTISSYEWEKVSGPTGGAISSPTAAKTNITNPAVGNYVYSLTVTNAAGISSSGTVNVVVANTPPPAGGCHCSHTITPGPDGGIYSDGSKYNIQPGDTICVPAGKYPYAQFFNYSGTAEKPLVFINCGGIVQIGDGGKYGLIFNQCKFFKVTGSGTADKYGFVVDGRPNAIPLNAGLSMGKGCTDYEAERIEVSGASAGLLCKVNPDCDPATHYPNFKIRNVSLHDLYVHDIGGEGLYIGHTLPNPGEVTCTDGSVIMAAPPRIYNLKIYNVTTRNTGWDGIQVASAPEGVEIYNNDIYNYGTVNKGSQQAGIIMGGASSGLIYNNKVEKGTGSGIQIFGSGLTKVYDNIVIDAGWDGGTVGQDAIFADDRPITDGYVPLQVEIINNTIINARRHGVMILSSKGTTGKNNIVYNNLITKVGSPMTGDRAYINIMTGVDNKTSNNVLLTDIAAAEYKNVAGGDYSLLAGSQAIDKGIDARSFGVNLDFDGNARPFNNVFDAGAFEYTGGTAVNKPPVAKAGSDITITLPVTTASLDGSTSTDADGTIKSYNWAKISGGNGTITSPNASKTDVTGLAAGTYVFELTVTDDKDAFSQDRITVTVNPAANKLPVAKAGNDITITLPANVVEVNANASTDEDGTIQSYNWAKISGPAATIVSAGSAITVINGLVAGTYVFELTVTDDKNATAKDRITITVNPAGNKPPVAKAGNDITLTLPTDIAEVNGNASTDEDGTIQSYQWAKISGPAANIVSPGSAITIINHLSAGTYVFELTVTDDKNITAKDQVTIIVNPAANKPPVAEAGDDIVITLPTDAVDLDGRSSIDEDGTIRSYSWAKISGPAANIVSPASSLTTVNHLSAGTYVFELTVTDDKNTTAKDRITVTVNPSENIPPVARAGSDITVTLPANSAELNGSESTDEDGTVNTYSWTKISGPDVSIATPAAAVSSISGLEAGVYVFELRVTDDKGATATDQVTVIVNAADNKSPIARAGDDITIKLPVNSVQLNGTASTDEDGTINAYSWAKISGPAATITNANVSSTLVNGLTAGTYVFELTVRDDKNASSKDRVTVTVQSVDNKLPVANAGSDITIRLPENTADLNGAASRDEDGTVVSYHWEKISGPAASIATPGAAGTAINDLVAGTYVFELTVTDNDNATAKDRVTVNVLEANEPVNEAPIANAGPDREVNAVDEEFTLDGSASRDVDGSIERYQWEYVSGNQGIIILSPSSVTTKVRMGLAGGVHEFRLTVTDNKGQTASDLVRITVLRDSVPPAHDIVSISLYPNPATDFIQLKLNDPLPDNVVVNIFNTSGRLEQSMPFKKGDLIQQPIDISRLAKGFYLLQITNGKDLKEVRKFVKQ
ncbi:PKD domain-containing protein [Chitinophaga barathri]|uniref:PKD domain-containing protein n=1 Tax=Chitinophaga barathri TaxID=1647451 RepID=UPI000EA214D8|nr:PKD domain-containing protein [Chitinophaga barathri]